MESQSGECPFRVEDFSFPSPEVTKDPFPFYKALRSQSPVFRNPETGDFLVSRRKDIDFVLKNPEIFSNRNYLADPRMAGESRRYLDTPPPIPGDAIQTVFSLTMSDPPEHGIKRRALRSLVNPRYVRNCEETLERIANELIDVFIDRGEVELRKEFADPLALLTICELAGFPPEDRATFLSWNRIGTGHGRRFLTEEQLQAQDKDIPARDAYCEAIIKDRLDNPRDDFLTEVVHAQVARDGALNLPYLTAEIGLILTAGNETTSRLIANVMRLLIEHPDQLALLLADRALIPGAVDEALRFESPTQWTSRLALEDTEIDGMPIPKGSYVLMLFGSANRDESWGDPDVFRVDRKRGPDLMAFGGGIHRCLGFPIALAEGRIALSVLLDRLKNPRFASGHEADRENIDNFQKRVPKELHIEFDR
ncbi:cytochrome P450 [Sphingomonas sp. CGMCC 1.13654]|uniref:Cytochrome P450 n=1 Tax=Sphingomonas chungangi TaxID=2683589 RepID=A0A838L285_9SPHN|nr:cytochrome P450 [Sphingomonas chungangi]MBA2933030.1 cytochrome P450 [Sphingomonas chungangi]MVW56650.1 cytochrome P450 [Sphingomonas chungangi]